MHGKVFILLRNHFKTQYDLVIFSATFVNLGKAKQTDIV